MRVTVRLFARLREVAGAAELTCEVAPGATVADVWREVTTRHPGLAPFGQAVSCAVNEDFARPGASVREDDQVAFLPPVSGGATD
jgi:molybdopterin converting factor subunit 1